MGREPHAQYAAARGDANHRELSGATTTTTTTPCCPLQQQQVVVGPGRVHICDMKNLSLSSHLISSLLSLYDDDDIIAYLAVHARRRALPAQRADALTVALSLCQGTGVALRRGEERGRGAASRARRGFTWRMHELSCFSAMM